MASYMYLNIYDMLTYMVEMSKLSELIILNRNSVHVIHNGSTIQIHKHLSSDIALW